MFEIGDKIVYPMHGAGVIEDIEEKEILGKLSSYYVLRLPMVNMKVMIPVEKSQEIGVRFIVDEKALNEVMNILNNPENDTESNWNKRYRENMDKIKTGDIYKVAEVVRNLVILDRDKGLSTGEKKMLNNAKQILISEFSLIKGISKDDAEVQIIENI